MGQNGTEGSPFFLLLLYFVDLIFIDSSLSAKTMKIGPHENFPLYGINCFLPVLGHKQPVFNVHDDCAAGLHT